MKVIIITQLLLQQIQNLSYIQDYQQLTTFLYDLLIFNYNFHELQVINYLGDKKQSIESKINATASFLDFMKKQSLNKEKYKLLDEQLNKSNKDLDEPIEFTDLDEIDDFDEINTFQPIKKNWLYSRFDDPNKKLEDSFPYPHMRKPQQHILELLKQCDDKKFILIEAMPGTGKSAIAKTIISHCGNGYILTATKQLQDQYTDEFFDVVSIKGKSAYMCSKVRFETCKNGLCTRDPSVLNECRMSNNCPYINAKQVAKRNDITVTSYAYFFTWLNSKYRQNFSPREILILDEAHLLDGQMTAWTELILNPKHLDEKYHLSNLCDRVDHLAYITSPIFEENYTNNNQIIINMLFPLLERAYKNLVSDLATSHNSSKILSTIWGDDKDRSISDVDKRYKRVLSLKEDLDQILTKLRLFIKAPNKEEWLLSAQQNEKDNTNELLIKPLYMSKLFRQFVEQFGKKHIIFMSATILNARIFCEELGIKREEVAIIKEDSTFDPLLSPILYNPVGKMTYNALPNTMPKIIDMVKHILIQHPDAKGIIHTGNYSIANQICEYIHSKRLMMKTMYENNEALLRRHARSKNGVLVSPSLGTGTDLKDDAARFQIIVKLPFMSLADKRVKKKADLDYDWYSCEMLRSLIQSSGRATRSETDYSVTYILDSSFRYWVTKYQAWLPKSFLERICWNGKPKVQEDDDEFVIVS